MYSKGSFVNGRASIPTLRASSPPSRHDVLMSSGVTTKQRSGCSRHNTRLITGRWFTHSPAGRGVATSLYPIPGTGFLAPWFPSTSIEGRSVLPSAPFLLKEEEEGGATLRKNSHPRTWNLARGQSHRGGATLERALLAASPLLVGGVYPEPARLAWEKGEEHLALGNPAVKLHPNIDTLF